MSLINCNNKENMSQHMYVFLPVRVCEHRFRFISKGRRGLKRHFIQVLTGKFTGREWFTSILDTIPKLVIPSESRSEKFGLRACLRGTGVCGRDRDRSVPLPALNKHSNTSVKSNNFTINEIPICLQSISRWHFPHCNSALIKFLKCKNAWQRLKTSLGVNVPARGLWYLIFITIRPGQRKPEC